MKYDALVIGSGLGGLVSALILSREGMRVCVLEQHYKAGGNLQSFTRDGCVFDTGMHYLGSLDPGQYLHKYFDYLGIVDSLKLVRLDENAYDTITFDGDDSLYEMAMGYAPFTEHLLHHFPGEEKALQDYIKGIRSVVDHFPLYNISRAESYKLSPEALQGCAAEFLQKNIPDERLRNVLGGALSLYGGAPEKTPLYVHACMRDSLINSCWRPVDGSQQIAELLVEGILANGGEVRTSTRVERLNIDEGKVIAAVLEEGEEIAAENFISNAHPVATLKMIPEGKIRKIFRSRINSLPNTMGVFSLYAVLEEDSFPYLNTNYFHYTDKGILGERSEGAWPSDFYFYTPATTLTRHYAESLVVMADMDYSLLKPWEHTQVNRRGEDYREFKDRMAEKMLERLEARLPGIRGKIKKYYTSTPLTFRDYTSTHEGSAYGIMKDCHDPLRSIILPRTRISNLLFTGQNLNLHGVLGVTASAVITCSELLGLEYLSKKIAHG